MAAPLDAPTSHSYATFFGINDPYDGNYASLFAPFGQVDNYTPAQTRALVSNARSNNILIYLPPSSNTMNAMLCMHLCRQIRLKSRWAYLPLAKKEII